MLVANALAYYHTATITALISFIAQAPGRGDCTIKNITESQCTDSRFRTKLACLSKRVKVTGNRKDISVLRPLSIICKLQIRIVL
jgi:hypothetical protein